LGMTSLFVLTDSASAYAMVDGHNDESDVERLSRHVRTLLDVAVHTENNPKFLDWVNHTVIHWMPCQMENMPHQTLGNALPKRGLASRTAGRTFLMELLPPMLGCQNHLRTVLARSMSCLKEKQVWVIEVSRYLNPPASLSGDDLKLNYESSDELDLHGRYMLVCIG